MSEYQPARRRDPSSPLRKGTESLGRDLADFWAWSESDLLSNTTRGLLAEYIVGIALGCTDGTVRREWDAFDLLTESGLRIELKSSAYLQSWQQKSASAIKFAVGPAMAWFAETNSYAGVRERSADVYVFCLFTTTDRAVADPPRRRPVDLLRRVDHPHQRSDWRTEDHHVGQPAKSRPAT